jgi:hypothetical protein
VGVGARRTQVSRAGPRLGITALLTLLPEVCCDNSYRDRWVMFDTKEPRQLLTLAIVGSLLVNVATIPFFFVLPGSDEIPDGAIISGIVAGAIVVNALNVLSSLPAYGDPPSGAVITVVTISIVIGIAVIVLLRQRRVWALLH